YFIGRTEFDSPDVDNEVLIDATTTYLKTGEFYDVKINEAEDFDLYGEAVNVETLKPTRKEIKVRTE
ncbi:MAG: 30S ribosomal protein S12 methylthiotransferase RimO, partial [Gillisia sp.]|nr:30S ribosomal protein S12 methylthiotransferase RimO [Gillisia sp.]